MHTTRFEAEGVSYYCNHNGDFSGDVDIYKKTNNPGIEMDPCIATLPFALMEALVGEKLKDEEISKLESISGSEFLNSIFNYHEFRGSS